MLTLLLVDDEAIVLDLLKTQIDWVALGIDRVLSAHSMSQAMATFQRARVDILLCDIEMPQGTGLELLAWARGQGHDAATIFLTAHADFGYAKRAIALGSVDYVLKPVLFGELSEVVRRTVDKVLRDRENQSFASYGKRWLNAHIGEGAPAEDADRTPQVVDAICDYIDENLDKSLCREEIAAHVGLSPEYVSRIFSKEKQIALTGYIQRKKIDAAKAALETSQLSVSEIARRLGYDNFAYFSKVFKKLTGRTPQDYRRNNW